MEKDKSPYNTGKQTDAEQSDLSNEFRSSVHKRSSDEESARNSTNTDNSILRFPTTSFTIARAKKWRARGKNRVRIQNALKRPKRMEHSVGEGHNVIFPMLQKVPKAQTSSVATDVNEDMEDFREFRTNAWVEENLRRVVDAKEEEEMIGLRMKELLDIPKDEYLNVLYEIRYLRDQQLQKRKAKQKARLRANRDTEAKERREIKKQKTLANQNFGWSRIKKHGSFRKRCCLLCKWARIKCSICWRESLLYHYLHRGGFFTSDWAITFHNGACLAIIVWGFILLRIANKETRELRGTIGGVDSGGICDRRLSTWAAALIFTSGICGILGTFLRQGVLIYTYLVFFIIGWCIHMSNESYERSLVTGDAISKILRSEIKAYVTDKSKPLDFLNAVQTEFRCCGAVGPSDYGYNKAAVLPGQKFDLPQSCCHYQSFSYIAKKFTGCFISPNLNPELQIFVHFEGCEEMTKRFFQNLFRIKEYFFLLTIFVTTKAILSFLNLCYHYYGKAEEFKQYKRRKPTAGELLLEAIEDNLLQSEEFEFEKTAGSIETIRKKLAECETISDFVRVILSLIRDVDFIVYADPEALARAILGLTPRDILKPHNRMKRRNPLELPVVGVKQQEELAKSDLKFRYLLQNNPRTAREELEIRKQRGRMFPKMQFPLPPPHSGIRETSYEWGNVVKKLKRNDKIIPMKSDDLGLQKLKDSQGDRVVKAPAPVVSSFWDLFVSKVAPADYYTDMEDEQFRTEVDILAKIISEAQAMIRDLHRKTKFVGQFKDHPTDEVNAVQEAVKLIMATDAVKDFKPSTVAHPIRFRTLHPSALADSNIQNTFKGFKSKTYSAVAEHVEGGDGQRTGLSVKQNPNDDEMEYVTIGIQAGEPLSAIPRFGNADLL